MSVSSPLQKFGRAYQLYVWAPIPFVPGQVGIPSLATPPIAIITNPITLELDVERNRSGSMNHAHLRVYNLSLVLRNLIRYTQANIGTVQQVMLRAGYGPGPFYPVVFFGNITQAYNRREGVNIVTVIEALDGGTGVANGQVQLTFPPGTPFKSVITTIAGLIPNTVIGAMGNYVDVLTRQLTVSGSPIDILNDLVPNQLFIDNGAVNVLQQNEAILTPVPTVISPASGLLNTPQLESSQATFEMLFEPALHAGQTASIVSTVEDNFTGVYILNSVKHRGVISGTLSGDLVTSGTFTFNKAIVPVPSAAPPF